MQEVRCLSFGRANAEVCKDEMDSLLVSHAVRISPGKHLAGFRLTYYRPDEVLYS